MSLHAVTGYTLSEMIPQQGLALVDFGAPWCSPCRSLNGILEELDAELGGEMPLLKLNVDESPEAAAAYGVMSLPTVIIFCDGQPHAKFVGLRSKDAYRRALTGA